jgi:hypothetical protein
VNEDGQLYGWSPNVPRPGSTTATLADAVPGAIFKGADALGRPPLRERLPLETA